MLLATVIRTARSQPFSPLSLKSRDMVASRKAETLSVGALCCKRCTIKLNELFVCFFLVIFCYFLEGSALILLLLLHVLFADQL